MNFLKKMLRITFLWGGFILVGVGGIQLYLHGGQKIGTDNAYLKARKYSISSQVSAAVTEVAVVDYGRIKKGDLLFKLDASLFEVAVAHAEASLAKVRTNIESLRADYYNKLADITKVESELAYTSKEYLRLQKLFKKNSVSAREVEYAQFQAEQSERKLDIEKQALEVVLSKLISPDITVELHPDYQLARSELDRAKVNLAYTEVRAPSDGVVARLNLKEGEFVNAGLPLFTVVDDSEIWLEANYKETELTHMKVGQSASLHVDTYPELEWQGHVTSIAPGTGAEFSLLPAQNTTGNWVKVVQRVTVKVALDKAPLEFTVPTLISGMSVYVEVDTGHKRQLSDLF
jgi:membrane fusion protein (multidrug efflux system)